MGMLRRRWLLLLMVTAAPVLSARAEEPPSVIPDPDTDAARRHFDRGTALYGQQRYADAVREFETARRIKPLPAFDFNIARSFERLEAWAAAADAYDRYLDSLRAGKEADDIRARIAVLRARLDESAVPKAVPSTTSPASPPARLDESAVPKAVPSTTSPASPPVTSPPATAATPASPPAHTPAPQPPPGSQLAAVNRPEVALEAEPTTVATAPSLFERHRVATWAVAGGGVALLAGSLIAGLVAHSRYGDLSGHCATDGSCNSTTVPNAQGWIDSGHAAGVASDALLGVGLAAVVTGVVLFFVEGRHPVERQAWRVSPTIGAAGAGFSVEVLP